jgi:S-adenosyl methyltransferase
MAELSALPSDAPSQPSIARIYDYTVGGTNNYEIDRQALYEALKVEPTGIWMARENRAYLGRVVRYLAEECGIRQFVDHGSGLPTRENVHQVAHRYAPDSRVVYIDRDPVVLAHGRALLADNDNTVVITADMGHPEDLLGNPEVRRLIDFDQPVALLFISVLHCLKDERDPWGAVRRLLAAVPSGSYLAVSTVTAHTREHADAVTQAVLDADPSWGRVRMRAEIDPFFDGVEVVPPGLGDIGEWRLDLGPRLLPLPESPPEGGEWPPEWRDDVADRFPRSIWEHGGVGRKP